MVLQRAGVGLPPLSRTPAFCPQVEAGVFLADVTWHWSLLFLRGPTSPAFPRHALGLRQAFAVLLRGCGSAHPVLHDLLVGPPLSLGYGPYWALSARESKP